MSRRTGLFGLLAASSIALPPSSYGQEGELVAFGEDTAVVVSRIGTAAVLQAHGPYIYGTGYKSIDAMQYRWYAVQDSSLGIVFTEPSGIKAIKGGFDGDIDLEFLRHVRAFDVRLATFNVWGEFTGTLKMTRVMDYIEGETPDFDPRWSDFLVDNREHFATVIFIYRVRYPDGSVIVADLAPVLEVAKSIDESVTIQDLEPEPDVDLRELPQT